MFKIFAKIGHHFLMNNCIIYKYLTNCLLNSPGARVTNSAAQKRLQAGAKFDLCFEKGGGGDCISCFGIWRISLCVLMTLYMGTLFLYLQKKVKDLQYSTD